MLVRIRACECKSKEQISFDLRHGLAGRREKWGTLGGHASQTSSHSKVVYICKMYVIFVE